MKPKPVGTTNRRVRMLQHSLSPGHVPTAPTQLLAGLLLAGSLVFSACVPGTLANKDGGSPAARVHRYDEAVRVALADREAYPDDPTVVANLVQALLNAHEYSVAFEEAQKLRELDPSSPRSLELLGHACFGLGLFDEAAACFNGALKLGPSDDAAWWLAYILIARGNREEARQVLLGQVNAEVPEWRIYQLLLEVTPSDQDRLALVQDYRRKIPGNEEAAVLEASLQNGTPQVGYGRIIAGEGEILRARLTDYYTVSLKLNDTTVLARFAAGRSGLLLSEAAVKDLNLSPTGYPGPLVRGLGGEGIARSEIVKLRRVEIGNVVLEDVSAQLVKELFTTDAVAVIGSDLLPGYSYRLDRKNELLTMYPPSMEVPKPSESSWIQHYYQMEHLIVTDSILRNRTTDQSWKAKVSLATDAQNTILNLSYAQALNMGKVDTTQWYQAKGLTGYHRLTAVGFVELEFGGNRFLSGGFRGTGEPNPFGASGDGFYAGDLSNLGTFIPFAQLGRDVLRRYLITVDKQNHRLFLDTYEN